MAFGSHDLFMRLQCFPIASACLYNKESQITWLLHVTVTAEAKWSSEMGAFSWL